MVHGMNKLNTTENKVPCEGCIMGKQHWTPYPNGIPNNASEPIEMINSVICGPMNVDLLESQSILSHSLTISRDKSALYYLKQKSEVLEKSKELVDVTNNLTSRKVKILRTDNGGKYC